MCWNVSISAVTGLTKNYTSVSKDGTIASLFCLCTFSGLPGSGSYVSVILTEVGHNSERSEGAMFEVWFCSLE